MRLRSTASDFYHDCLRLPLFPPRSFVKDEKFFVPILIQQKKYFPPPLQERNPSQGDLIRPDSDITGPGVPAALLSSRPCTAASRKISVMAMRWPATRKAPLKSRRTGPGRSPGQVGPGSHAARGLIAKIRVATCFYTVPLIINGSSKWGLNRRYSRCFSSMAITLQE